MKLNKRDKWLIECKSEEMSFEDWYEYYHNPKLLQYRLDTFEPIIPRYRGTTIRDEYKTFNNFYKSLTNFIPKYRKELKPFLRQFYRIHNSTPFYKEGIQYIVCNIIYGKKYHKRIAPMNNLMYLRKGYTVEESENIIKKLGRNNVKFNPSSVEYYLNKGYSQTKAEKLRSKYMGEMNLLSVQHWLNKGYSLEDSKSMSKQYSDDINPSLESYWIKKGYTDKDEIRDLITKLVTRDFETCRKGWKTRKKFYKDYVDKLRINLHKNIPNINQIQYYTFGSEKHIDLSSYNHSLSDEQKFIRLDFYLETKDGFKLNIEFDDKHHRVGEGFQYNSLRDNFLNSIGITVFRISDKIYNNPDNFDNTIKEVVNLYEDFKNRRCK